VAATRDRLGEFQIVLILDAARIHYAPQVLRACTSAGVWPIVVPAGMTFLLQSLDTHAFALYKAELVRSFHAARAGSADAIGDIDVRAFLACVYGTIKKVLQGNRWALAFDRDGFGLRQSALSVRVLRCLNWQGPVGAPLMRPSAVQVQLCLPKRAKASHVRLLAPYDHAVAMVAPAAASVRPLGVSLAPAAAAAVAAPPMTRLRSKTVAAAAAAGAASCLAGRAPDAPVVYGKTRAETRGLKAKAVGL
jgi:hypothetical protein